MAFPPSKIPQPEGDQRIAAIYKGAKPGQHPAALAALAREWDCNPKTIHNRALKLGCATPKFKYRTLSEREKEIIRENICLAPITIQRKLSREGYSRTLGSIRTLRKRYADDCAMDDLRLDLGYTTTRALAKCLGVPLRNVQSYIERGLLRSESLAYDEGRACHIIHESAIREFVVNHTAHVARGKPDIFWLVDIVNSRAKKPVEKKPRQTKHHSIERGAVHA